jgi:hypothetical protein
LIALPELAEQGVGALPKEFVREWTRINANKTRKDEKLQRKTFTICSLLFTHCSLHVKVLLVV